MDRLKRAVAAAALALASCTSRHLPPAGAGSLTIGQQQEPISLNPALENGQRSTEWGELLFSYLLKYDDHDRLTGDVATEVPTLQNGGISRDGRTIVYHLRRDVRFADGVRLTARDCVWSIGAVLNPANNVQTRFGYDRVGRAYAANDYELVLRLKQPFAPILTTVLAPQGFPILPEHLLARYHDLNHLAFNQKPIGSGPYVVDAWLHGDRAEMHANPTYFLGEPKIRNLVVRFIPDPQEATNQLQAHEIQAYFNEQDYAQYSRLRGLRGYYVLDRPVSAVGALIFNTQHPVVGNAAVRHALAEAIDLKAVVRKSYAGALDAREAGRGLFLWAFDPRRYPDVEYDPAAARRVLTARRRPIDVLLAIQAGVPGEGIAADQIAQYERAAGVNVAIKQYNVTQFGAPAQLGGPIYGGKFDMALYSFVNGDDPDTTDQFACADVPPNGYNKSRMCDRRVDALLYAGASTYETGARKRIYARLQSLLYAELPIVLLYQRRELDAFDGRLRGPSGSIDSVFWNVAAWRWTPA